MKEKKERVRKGKEIIRTTSFDKTSSLLYLQWRDGSQGERRVYYAAVSLQSLSSPSTRLLESSQQPVLIPGASRCFSTCVANTSGSERGWAGGVVGR